MTSKSEKSPGQSGRIGTEILSGWKRTSRREPPIGVRRSHESGALRPAPGGEQTYVSILPKPCEEES
jgi:hypothetical protein